MSESGTSGTPAQVAKLTPMLRHYLEVKSEHPGALLLYRMGDFFETFFEDAEIAAPIFEIQLTARQKGTPSEAPMCGVPHHAIDSYIAKLLRAGRTVAICDQVEDPATAKGLVRREVTRVISPGTVSDPELLDSARANHLVAILPGGGERSREEFALARLEVSTGDLSVRRFASVVELLDAVRAEPPGEVLLPEDLAADHGMLEELRSQTVVTERLAADVPDEQAARRTVERQLGVDTMRGFGVEADSGGVLLRSAAMVLDYARGNLRTELDHVRDLRLEEPSDWVVLDEATQRNLELFVNQREGSRAHTLVSVLDRTSTPMGARLLRSWIAQPLRSASAIEQRLDAVETLQQTRLQELVLAAMRQISDLERITTRAVVGTISPTEVAALRHSLEVIPELQVGLRAAASPLLRRLARTDPLEDLAQYLVESVAETPVAQLSKGGVIADGFSAELDRLRSLAGDAKGHLLAMEQREREATGIGSLKIRFNRVFGYYIEVTKTHQALVPERYQRKQTLANAERYVTDELNELEEQILSAEQQQQTLEEELFGQVRSRVAGEAGRLKVLAHAVAQIDVLRGLAEVAADLAYVRPQLVDPREDLRIDDGRHPVVERSTSERFVPNDTVLGPEAGGIVLLTGPNMGGKSTYLRQVALICLMAHIGSYVPASQARIPIVDRVFTRVGASDNLARGESTFMVEMIETANILRYATSDSLVVLDEVGRGTATYDGLSLAWAIVEFLHDEIRCRTLFATHYHELTQLSDVFAGVRNHMMRVKEWQDRIVFLHRVDSGSADRSYGIQVARLAGLPARVLDRAAEVLDNLESSGQDRRGRPKIARGTAQDDGTADQLTLFARSEDVVADLIRELDLDRLTPLAALNLLATLRDRLRGEDENGEVGTDDEPADSN